MKNNPKKPRTTKTGENFANKIVINVNYTTNDNKEELFSHNKQKYTHYTQHI